MSRYAADHLIQKAHTIHAFSQYDSHVLDVGPGTGAVPESITNSFPGVRILATDITSGMIGADDKKHLPNVSIRVVLVGIHGI